MPKTLRKFHILDSFLLLRVKKDVPQNLRFATHPFPYLIGHRSGLVPQVNMEPHFSDAQLAWFSGVLEPRQYLHIRWTELILVDLVHCDPSNVVVLQLLGHPFLNCGME